MGKFIDFDKKDGMFYDNFWLDEQKLVIKMPLPRINYSDKHPNMDFRIEEFNLVNCIYLLGYD
ncbi:MAG: hypothetical protein ACFFDK_11880 [Promethearchaeota archaeon]